MEETRPFVSWDLVHDFMVDVFVKYGVPEEDARICTDVLLESDRRGIESHGCNRFKPIYLNRIKNGTLLPKTEIEIVKDTPCTVVMDAHNGMGMVASHKMMEMLIEKASKYGMAGGTIFNSTHYGIAGYWTTMAEKAGMIGISGTNARPSVAPTFGVEPMMGTNPLTFTMPTDEEFPFNWGVRSGRTGMNLIIYQVMQLQVMHVTDGYSAVKVLACTSVTQPHLTVSGNRNALPELSVFTVLIQILCYFRKQFLTVLAKESLASPGLAVCCGLLASFLPFSRLCVVKRKVYIIICQIQCIHDIALVRAGEYRCGYIEAKGLCCQA